MVAPPEAPSARRNSFSVCAFCRHVRKARFWPSFWLRFGAHVQSYVPLRCSPKPRRKPGFAGGYLGILGRRSRDVMERGCTFRRRCRLLFGNSGYTEYRRHSAEHNPSARFDSVCCSLERRAPRRILAQIGRENSMKRARAWGTRSAQQRTRSRTARRHAARNVACCAGLLCSNS